MVSDMLAARWSCFSDGPSDLLTPSQGADSTVTLIPEIPPVTDLGYYFTDWIWRAGSTDFMKSMLLLFDGLTLSLPTNIATEMIERDPILATPLAERRLLFNFDPASTSGVIKYSGQTPCPLRRADARTHRYDRLRRP